MFQTPYKFSKRKLPVAAKATLRVLTPYRCHHMDLEGISQS